MAANLKRPAPTNKIMGNFDRWSTPKQIKIERAGEPRPLRRGPLKKSERKKGRKARIDEVVAEWKRYKFWQERSDAHRARGEKQGWAQDTQKWADGHLERHRKLVEKCQKDGIEMEACESGLIAPFAKGMGGNATQVQILPLP